MKRYGLAITELKNSCYTEIDDIRVLPNEFDSVEEAQDKIVDIYLYAKMKASLVNHRLYKNSVWVQNYRGKEYSIFIIQNGDEHFKDIRTKIIRERANRATKKEWFELTKIQ